MDIWGVRCLVGAVNTSKVFQLATAGFCVEAFDIAAFAFDQRGINKHLHKFSGLEQAARQCAVAFKGRYKADQHDQPGIDHEFGSLGDTAYVFSAAGFGKSQVAVETVADVVAVKHIAVFA